MYAKNNKIITLFHSSRSKIHTEPSRAPVKLVDKSKQFRN